jgi:hypothetical protein
MFMQNIGKGGSNPFETVKLRVMNRCGATALVLGDVVALDLKCADADTRSGNGVGGLTSLDVKDAIWHNITEVGAAPANAIVAVVTSLLTGAGADNTEVEVAISGLVTAKLGGTDWSTAYASCGVALMADITGANRRLIAATDAANRGKVALCQDNVATNLSAANSTANVLLFGWGSSVGTLGA